MLLLNYLCLAESIDLQVLIWGASELVTVVYGPVVIFAFPDPRKKRNHRM